MPLFEIKKKYKNEVFGIGYRRPKRLITLTENPKIPPKVGISQGEAQRIRTLFIDFQG